MADTYDNSQKRALSLLEDFGVPEVAAKIYLHLITNPPLSIVEISKHLGIPRTTVYDNVKVLIERKLAERVQTHKGHKIKAFPVSTLISAVEEQQARADELRSAYDQLEEMLALPPNVTSLTEVRYYQGANGLEQMIWNTLKAKNGIVGYSTYGRREIVGKRFYKRFVEEFAYRKISDRVIINPDEKTLSYLKKYVLSNEGHHQGHTPDVIRYLPESDVYINGDTMIYNDTFAVAYWRGGEVVGFEIDNKEFVKTQRSIFETLWRQAKPVFELL